MVNILIVLTFLYVGSQILAFAMLFSARSRSISAKKGRINNYPGVSIITSLKGPTPGAIESVRSLLEQDYPGEMQFVFAVLNEQEILIEPVKKLFASSRHQVKWIFPVDTNGLNPRTAKIAKAFEASTQPWIFMICVDTRFAKDYLRKAVELSATNEENYVTSFPVIDQATSFFAKLEAIGLNVDVSQFFLISSISRSAACAYGGAFLYSRKLLQKAGGYTPILKYLTDDITLAKALSKVGGRCLLTDEFAYVHQEILSAKSFWSRQIRWRMIGRFFLPKLFWLGPLAWNQLFLLVGALALGENILYWMLLILSLSRVAIGYSTQILLRTPRRDRLSAWLLPLYDWIAIAAWCFAFVKNSVTWGDQIIPLDSSGAVRSADKVVLK